MSEQPATASMEGLSPSARAHLESLANFYDDPLLAPGCATNAYREVLSYYYHLQIRPDASVLEIGCGQGGLLALLRARRLVGIDLSERQIQSARKRVPNATFYVQAGETLTLEEKFDYVILSDTVNYAADVQRLFSQLHRVFHESTRLILNFYNTLWRSILTLATRCGARAKTPATNWLARSDIRTLLELADWEVVAAFSQILVPLKALGLGILANRYLAPLTPHLCLTNFCVARPRLRRAIQPLSCSIIIPARNEAGNIEAAVRRVPQVGTKTELIFVEGHSSDGTWKEILRVADAFLDHHIISLQQSGTGKGDAVRAGFAAATGDVLIILDADLTIAPEELSKFYEVIASGRAEFANGVRLVYPMEDKAMRFLNLCANKAFSLLFSWLLNQPVKDTLCGSKAIRRHNYERLAANRSYFGEFDPFGDFDLLFGAGKLNLKIADVAVRYGGRTYGSTNIARWRHGWLLLRMAMVAARRMKFA